MMKWRILSLAAMVPVSALFLAGCAKDDPTGPSTPRVPAGWYKAYGGPGKETGQSVRQTRDGGYIIAGWSISPTSDKEDILLLKIDAVGDSLWATTIAAPHGAIGKSVLQTSDGGYLVLADYSPLGPNREFWLVKTDSTGNMEWNQWKGYNDRQEWPSEIQPTSDGGYILIGTTDRGGSDLDIWLVKIGPSAQTHWYTEKGYGSCNEVGASVQQTADGGYLLAGTSYCGPDSRIWLVKIYADGSTHWYKTVDTDEPAEAIAVRKTTDNAYVIMADVWGNDNHLIYLFKYDDAGNELWREANGVSGKFWGGEVQQTTDGGFLIACTKLTVGAVDFCLIKLDTTGKTRWTKTFDPAYDWCYSGGQTEDGGYILCGYTMTPGVDWSRDVFLVKTDPNGNVE